MTSRMKRLLAAALLVAACSKGPDERIAREYHELWVARGPAPVARPCTDAAVRYSRLAPLLQLHDATHAWHSFSDPLPPPVAAQLSSLVPDPTAADDLRCMAEDPASRVDIWSELGRFGALLYLKGESVAATDPDAGWRQISESLHLFHDPPAFEYLYFFTPAWMLERASALAASHPSPDDLRASVLAAAATAVMPKAALCAGLREELLVQSGMLFYADFPEMHDAFIARWPGLAPLLDGGALETRRSYDEWQSFRAVADAITRDCDATSTSALRQELVPLGATIKQRAPDLGMIFDALISRIDAYDQLVASDVAFRARFAH